MPLYGTVEIGGTKTDVAFGTSPADLSEPTRITTTTPGETLGLVAETLSSKTTEAVGVAAFGPIDLERSHSTYGHLLTTPKPGWSNADILGPLAAAVAGRVGIDTDVNGAALGEGRWGATRDMARFAYMTVGTGLGVGVVVGGKTLRTPTHPEMGHIPVGRLDGDAHPGSCPYHGDCLEGMAAGPALQARFGAEDWTGNERVVRVAAHYVAQGIVNLVYTMAPERVVVGGGVASLPDFHQQLKHYVSRMLAGYPTERDLDMLIARPGLDALSGLAGGLVLAERAN